MFLALVKHHLCTCESDLAFIVNCSRLLLNCMLQNRRLKNGKRKHRLINLTCSRLSFILYLATVFNLFFELTDMWRHTLQYKSIAEVNEDALKQIEVVHENFKIEVSIVNKS